MKNQENIDARNLILLMICSILFGVLIGGNFFQKEIITSPHIEKCISNDGTYSLSVHSKDDVFEKCKLRERDLEL